MSKDDKIPVAYCEVCKVVNPMNIQTLQKTTEDGKKLKADIGYCVVCGTVLNLEEDKEITWVGNEWLAENGWKEVTDE